MEEREILRERLELALLRIREIPGEDFQGAELLPWKEYFTTVAKFLLLKIFCRKIMRTVLPIRLML